MNAALERVRAALAAGGWKTRATGPDSLRAQCPAHGGEGLNLGVKAGDQGVLVFCHSRKCGADEIADALGLKLSDLSDRDGRAVYDYGNGHRVIRTRTASGKAISQENAPPSGMSTTLYVPERSRPISESPTVVLCEGEKAADAAVRIGATCAATWPGGSGGVARVDLEPLRGRRVVIIPDRDEPGEKALRALVSRLNGLASEVHVWRVPGTVQSRAMPVGADAADVYLADGTLDDLELDSEIVSEILAAPEQTETHAAHEPSPWQEVDLGSIIDEIAAGTYEPTRPTIGRLTDGSHLFYPGAVNTVAGHSGTGKTMLMLSVAVGLIERSKHVVFVDLEDTAASAAQRLVSDLGASPVAVRRFFHYIDADGPASAGVEAAIEVARQHRAALVIVDSLGESLASDGANPNADEEVARFFQRVARPLSRTGAAVVLLDHLAKAESGAEGFGIGSHRKRAAVTGALYVLSLEKSFARGVAGSVSLTVGKDRHGTRPAKSSAGRVTFDPKEGGGLLVTMWGPRPEQIAADDGSRPEVMARVVKYLAENPGASGNQIEKAEGIGARADTVRRAVKVLTEEGRIEVRQDRQKKAHYLVQTEPRPTSSHLVPDEVETTGSNLVPSSRPYSGTRDEVRIEANHTYPSRALVPDEVDANLDVIGA